MHTPFNYSSTNRSKKLTIVPYVFIMYMLLSAGPYRVELLAGAAGPFMAIIGLLFLPLIWTIPGMLMTIELVSTFPENGGYVIWAMEAFGPFWGYLMGFWKLASSVSVLTSYLAIFVSILDDLSSIMPYFIIVILSAILLSILIYATNLTNVGYTLMGLSMTILLPFVILCLVAVPKIRPRRWLKPDQGGDYSADFRLYCSAIFCLLSYWDDVSTIAGEADEAPKTFQRAILIASLLRFLSHAIPLLAITGALPLDQDLWTNGYYKDAADSIAGNWMKNWIMLGGALAIYGRFQATLVCTAYVFVGMASSGILPKAFGERLSWSGAPSVGITIPIILSIMFLFLGNDSLAVTLNLLQAFAILLEFASFLWLRWKLPDIERPYKVPVGIPGMVIICLVSTAFLVFIQWLQPVLIGDLLLSVLFTLVGIFFYLVMQICKSKNWLEFYGNRNF